MAFEVATAQDAKSRGEIADLIVASSATWPMTNVPIVDGRVYVDGSLVDNVPIRALSPEARSGKTLVLLTRPIPEDLLSQGNSTHYLAPTEKLPITVWDYTSPDKIQEAFEQGLRDARRATATLEAFLAKGW
jgi:predicted acylesterase/phospholipase RssA